MKGSQGINVTEGSDFKWRIVRKGCIKLLTQSIFPESWKEAVVTPILKKGSAHDKTNYRPVSCLMVLSKVLEKVVCEQITNFIQPRLAPFAGGP